MILLHTASLTIHINVLNQVNYNLRMNRYKEEISETTSSTLLQGI